MIRALTNCQVVVRLPCYCGLTLTTVHGCLREIGEIGIRSIDAQITQTTINMTKTMVNVILNYLPIALFLSNNHPEMYCSPLQCASKPSVYTRTGTHSHCAGEPYDVDQLVVKYYCSCVNCGF